MLAVSKFMCFQCLWAFKDKLQSYKGRNNFRKVLNDGYENFSDL